MNEQDLMLTEKSGHGGLHQCVLSEVLASSAVLKTKRIIMKYSHRQLE